MKCARCNARGKSKTEDGEDKSVLRIRKAKYHLKSHYIRHEIGQTSLLKR